MLDIAAILKPLHGPPDSLVILLHGYGADGADMIGLGHAWQQLLPTSLFLAPNAPEKLPFSSGRQWFPLATLDPLSLWRGVCSAHNLLHKWLDQQMRQYHIPSHRIALVGFSQGGMMALHTGLCYSPPLGALISYSGLFVCPPTGFPFTPAPLPIFLFHGTEDETIPPAALALSLNNLKSLNCSVQGRLSEGVSHTIDHQWVDDGASFLKQAFKQ